MKESIPHTKFSSTCLRPHIVSGFRCLTGEGKGSKPNS